MRTAIWVVLALATASSTVDAGEIRFNRDIRPILSDKCFACHGPDSASVAADLRLDNSEAAKSYGAFVPGEPDESVAIARIYETDAELVMPPPESHKTLSNEERATLKQWVEEGAKYESHWAYTPVQAISSSVDGNVVDHFVSNRLQSLKVTPAEPADRITLIRRLSFDLTGLPPTPEEVDAYLHDTSDAAYTKLVDRLLASPRFGERIAAYWLDLVRYADTVGYHGDQEVSQWAYRDYVIESFNANVPYDQFIKEQLAGDLLPNSTVKQQIASGYNRLNQTTEEGGSQAKEYLAIYFADRVRNASQVFLGSTLGCAQCHDHKYDPFTAKDFYSFGAFFADLEERGVYGGRGTRPPVLELPTEEQKQTLATLESDLATAESKHDSLRAQLVSRIGDWTPPGTVERVWIDDNQPGDRNYSGTWAFNGQDTVPARSGLKSRRQSSEALVQHFFDRAKPTVSAPPASSFYAWVYLDPADPPSAIMLQLNDGKGWEHRAVWGNDDIPYGRRTDSWNGYRRMGALPPIGQWIRLEVPIKDVGFVSKDKPDTQASIHGMAFTQFGGVAFWDAAGWVESLPEDVNSALSIAISERTAAQSKTVEDYYLTTSKEFDAAKKRIAASKGKIEQLHAKIPTTVVSKSVTPREIRILPRGNWMDDSGEIVEPAIPEFLGQLNVGDRRANRLDLANWIASNDNPLTARTMANRVWGLLFGRGICTSLDDFGGQGTFPSDPDLLDALADQFVNSGWDIKHLIRLIVQSDTYKRSSRPTEQLRKQDPYNDLFARQGRYRVQAEVVRDMALNVSGLLVERVGGPSVRPYQPVGYYAQLNFPKRTYAADAGNDQYRRAIYTHWQRTYLHPMLKAFDAPSREECTAQRARSNTPLQALTLLNDPSFVEAARSLAEKIIREGGDTPESRATWAYRRVVSRPPEPEVVDVLTTLYERHQQHYQQAASEAASLETVGNVPASSNMDASELAAWTNVARTLLNLHEATTRY